MLLILVLMLEGCSLTPGMKMKSDNNNLSDVEVPVMKDGKLTKDRAKIMPITADLIIERENSRREAVNNLPPADDIKTAYRIGPHDRLQITVWDHPEINDPGGEKILPEMPAEWWRTMAHCISPMQETSPWPANR
jgi:polysaccharide export outer membrane protein